MHESFYEATMIEFTIWEDEQETIISKYHSFSDLPPHLHDELEKDSSEITLKGRKWVILEIARDLTQHGEGMHVRVRLGRPEIHKK